MDRYVAPVEAADAIFQRESCPSLPRGCDACSSNAIWGPYPTPLPPRALRWKWPSASDGGAAQLPDDALSKQFFLAFVDALSCRNGTELTAVSLFWNAITTEPGRAIRRPPRTTLPLSVLQSGNGGNDDPLLSAGYQMVFLRGDIFFRNYHSQLDLKAAFVSSNEKQYFFYLACRDSQRGSLSSSGHSFVAPAPFC